MKWWLLIGGAALIGLLTATAHVHWLSFSQEVSDGGVVIAAGAPARQSIVSHHPGLAAVTVRVAAPFPPDSQVVTLTVRDPVTQAPVVVVAQPFAMLSGPCVDPCGPNERGLRFGLPIQEDSAGRTYLLEFSTDGQPLTVAAHTLDVYSEGERFGPGASGDLAFRLDYNGQVAATLLSLARQGAAGRSGLFGFSGWLPGLALAYLVVLGLALRGLQGLFAQAAAETPRLKRRQSEAAAERIMLGPTVMSLTLPRLVIQIPCLNEAETLPTTLAAIPRQIPGVADVRILIIDDGSTDGTVEVARAHGVDLFVRHPQRRGLAAAFESGLQAALAAGADLIVNTDGDNQYPGEAIPSLIAPILEGRADLVVGDRKPGFNPEFSWSKRLLQRVGSWVVAQAAGTPVPDATSGFRAYTRDAALRLQLFTRYTYTLETLIQASKKGLRVAHVEVNVNPVTRPSRLMRSQWEYVKRSAATILRIYAIYEPLRTFGLMSLPFIVVGLGLLARFVVLYLLGYLNDGGARLLQSVFIGGTSLIIGILILIFGVLADLMAANRRLTEETLYRLKRLEFDRQRTPQVEKDAV